MRGVARPTRRMIDPPKVARSLEASEAVTGANPMNHSPAHAGDRRATERDVLLCYRVLHGREPENRQAVEVKMSGTVRDLVAGGLASGEFTSNPVAAMARGEPPLHARTSGGPGQMDLEWAAENLPLEQATRARLTDGSLLAGILRNPLQRPGVPPIRSGAPSRSGSGGRTFGSNQAAREGQERTRSSAPSNSVSERTSKVGRRIQSALDEPVTLEILADGEPSASHLRSV